MFAQGKYDELRAVSDTLRCWSYVAACAFDVGRASDSAAVMFGSYLATPFFLQSELGFDPVRVPAIHERLGQIYEARGDDERAALHYRAFIEMSKNADAKLQARVADARRRLERLTLVERPRGKAPISVRERFPCFYFRDDRRQSEQYGLCGPHVTEGDSPIFHPGGFCAARDRHRWHLHQGP